MMYESSSPFDVALAKPFLEEPAKKKFSLISSSTRSTLSSMFSDYYGENESDEDSDASFEEYEAPTLHDNDDDDEDEDYCAGEEVIVFGGANEMKSDQQTCLQLEASLKPVDVDLAILQERHGSFKEVHQSMEQIALISADLSALVHAQDDDIENLHALSIESMEHAQAGVKHLLRINQQREMKQRRSFFLLVLVILVGAFWVFSARVEGDDEEPEISFGHP